MRGVHHLTELVRQAAELPSSFSRLRVVELWAVGELLGAPRDLDTIEVAVVVDLPEVPWLTEPVGAEHWANATRASRNPIVLFWRSATAPVWNHRIERPVLVWSAAGGTVEEARAALADGTGERLRPPRHRSDGLAGRTTDRGIEAGAVLPRTIDWVDGRIVLVDQTALPGACARSRSPTSTSWSTRSAGSPCAARPALGVAGALGVALAARHDGADVAAAARAAARRPGPPPSTWPSASAGPWRAGRTGPRRRARRRARRARRGRRGLPGDRRARRRTARRAVRTAPLRLHTHCNAGALACVE